MPKEYFGLHSLRVLIQLIQGDLDKLEKKIGTGTSVEIVDDLETDDPAKALSANQGKVLDEKITSAKSALESKIGTDIASAKSELQGEISSAGSELEEKISAIDSDGDGIVDNAAKLGGHDASHFATVDQLEEASVSNMVEIDEGTIESMWDEVLGS